MRSIEGKNNPLREGEVLCGAVKSNLWGQSSSWSLITSGELPYQIGESNQKSCKKKILAELSNPVKKTSRLNLYRFLGEVSDTLRPYHKVDYAFRRAIF